MAKGSLGGTGEEDSPVKKRQKLQAGKHLNSSLQGIHHDYDESTLPSTTDEPVDDNVVSRYAMYNKQITINLSSLSNLDARAIKSKLVSELDQVRALRKRIEAQEGTLGIKGCSEKSDSLIMMKGKLRRSCMDLLGQLMKHKFGWVFKKPVDVEVLKLHDYLMIVKNPMDLGTVKTRMQKNWYKSPQEFAEDVRLTFFNAMLYNPKGQDVHSMAEELLKVFEEKWEIVETEFNLNQKLDTGTMPVDSDTAVEAEQKEDECVEREMSYEEKHNLRSSLENLSSEKLETVVNILRKRTPSLFQQEDEILLDLERLDIETLMELDRFVMNCNTSIDKNRSTYSPIPDTRHNLHETNLTSNHTETRNVPGLIPGWPIQEGKRYDNMNRSTSSSSSSSSDSDSSSSSETGSDKSS